MISRQQDFAEFQQDQVYTIIHYSDSIFDRLKISPKWSGEEKSIKYVLNILKYAVNKAS